MEDCELLINSINNIIGKNIKRARLLRKFSREGLARRIGVRAQQLYKYEIGLNNITIGRLMLICKVLSVDITTLLRKE